MGALLPFTLALLFINIAPAHGGTGCSELLVSGKHPIPDSSITASTSYPHTNSACCLNHFPHRSRINLVTDKNGNGGWSSLTQDDKQWLQFDLGFSRKITGVITKGREGYSSAGKGQYVTAYRLYYGNATDDMAMFVDNDFQPVIFDGNWDTVTPQMRDLDPPIYARYVRINPVKWNAHPSMRADLLGCPLTKDTNSIIG
ncbi:lactadherin [Lingula anatina]|uniref:Lactadherin n=1 Tax=Lingula anatina TaxID=7574 RepID=A0A1S3KEZ9_LINAN|nr:lactadherin [Lingula anatina]|eukprot:XP_013420821.1 lactadherin [Lingula anatina]